MVVTVQGQDGTWCRCTWSTATRSRLGRARGRQRPARLTRSTTGSSPARSTGSRVGEATFAVPARPAARLPHAARARSDDTEATAHAGRHAGLAGAPGAARATDGSGGSRPSSTASAPAAARGLGDLADLDTTWPSGRRAAGRRLRPGQPAARRRAAAAARAVAVPAQLAPALLQPALPPRRAASPSTPRCRRPGAGRGRPARSRRCRPGSSAAGPDRPRRRVDGQAGRAADRARGAAQRRAQLGRSRRSGSARVTRCTEFATWSVLAEDHGNDARELAGGATAPRQPGGRGVRGASTPTGSTSRCWLQWVLDEQLPAGPGQGGRRRACGSAPCTTSRSGVHPGGADAWRMQDVYAAGVQVGAPPDPYNQLGQDWSQPPWRPDRLAELGYQPFRDLIGAVLRHAGGVRVDHVIGLFRLWWIPERPAGRRGHLRPLRPRGADRRAGARGAPGRRRRRRRGPRGRRAGGARLPALARHPRHLDPLVRARRRRAGRCRPSTGASGAWPRSPPTTCRRPRATSPATRSGCSTGSGCSTATSTTSWPPRRRSGETLARRRYAAAALLPTDADVDDDRRWRCTATWRSPRPGCSASR